jgi:succinyldiaminopimelate transaminase
MLSYSSRLPPVHWDKLKDHATRARSHPDGLVDLSVGSPVDPVSEVVQAALAGAADSPGYPLTIGLEQTRQACLDWLASSHGVTGLGLDQVLPVIGSQELIASVAVHLDVGAGDLVVIPELAYPLYSVGALVAGARSVATDSLASLGDERPALVWLNSPANPTGRVLSTEELRLSVEWCRDRGAVLISDECYVECAWEAEAVSVLHPSVCGGSTDGILALHSLSKRSNLAGYRCAFVAGDPRLVAELHIVRKNLGLSMPGPQQVAMASALADTVHAKEQHERYAARRAALRGAFEHVGFRVEHSEGSLFLWMTRDEDCWESVSWLADRGILVAPGDFYGPAGDRHVRVGFTALDERVAAAVARLSWVEEVAQQPSRDPATEEPSASQVS